MVYHFCRRTKLCYTDLQQMRKIRISVSRCYALIRFTTDGLTFAVQVLLNDPPINFPMAANEKGVGGGAAVFVITTGSVGTAQHHL